MANVDWMPTLMSFAGLIPSDYTQISFDNDNTGNTDVPITFDGYNMHSYIMSTDADATPIRDHIVFQLRPGLDDDSNYDTDVDFDTLHSKIHLEADTDSGKEMVDAVDDLNLEEVAMVFYDSDGKLWKYFNAAASTNEIGNVESNCNWCALNHDGGDNIYMYTNSSGSVTKGLYDLDNDISESVNLLYQIDVSTHRVLMEIVSKNVVQYFDNEYSESSVYLYGNFDCFYEKHNIQGL